MTWRFWWRNVAGGVTLLITLQFAEEKRESEPGAAAGVSVTSVTAAAEGWGKNNTTNTRLQEAGAANAITAEN